MYQECIKTIYKETIYKYYLKYESVTENIPLISDVYLGPYQTALIELFCENRSFNDQSG